MDVKVGSSDEGFSRQSSSNAELLVERDLKRDDFDGRKPEEHLTSDNPAVDIVGQSSVDGGNGEGLFDVELEKNRREVDDGGESEVLPPSMADDEIQNIRPEINDLDDGSQIITTFDVVVVEPHSQLPRPEAPSGLSDFPASNDDLYSNRSQSMTESFTVDMPAIGKFIRERSNTFSAAIVKRLSSLKDENDEVAEDSKANSAVTEFNLSGLKVIVQLKSDQERYKELKGRISFFSRSNCRDCTAVRRFLREKELKYVEINIDVYPEREKELVKLTGRSSVPQIFFNEKLLGGLVAINSLRNSGEFDQRLNDMLSTKCPDDVPAPPVYGFDEPEVESLDEMIEIVRVIRQRLPIQDRLIKMKIVKNCFSGSEMVDVLVQHLDYGRLEAVEMGTKLSKKHFIQHVFGENGFADGNHFYRFLEHGPSIPKCFNFQGSVNDSEPKPAAEVGRRLTKIMSAILDSYASEDRCHLNYLGISNSEEFRRYVNLVHDLQRVNLHELAKDEKLAFFLNLYNAMVIHGLIRLGRPEGVIERKSFFSDFQYLVGGHFFSLSDIKNGILRGNRRPPLSLVKPFGSGDKRLELAFGKVNPLIHFGLCNGTRSSPTVRFFTPHGIESELRCGARDFFQDGGIEVDLDKRTVHLSGIIKWVIADFGQEKEILKWVMNYLDATKAGLLTHLVGDGGPIKIAYHTYDWSVNS